LNKANFNSINYIYKLSKKATTYHGIVTVDVEDNTVNYSIKSDLIVNIIYQGEIHHQILNHFNTSRDIFWAFNRLIEENEEPALIIADLLKMKEENKSED